MRMGQGVRTGLGHGGITCVLQTQFSSFSFFAHYLAEQIKKGVICVQILLEIHQTEHSRVHFEG